MILSNLLLLTALAGGLTGMSDQAGLSAPSFILATLLALLGGLFFGMGAFIDGRPTAEACAGLEDPALSYCHMSVKLLLSSCFHMAK